MARLQLPRSSRRNLHEDSLQEDKFPCEHLNDGKKHMHTIGGWEMTLNTVTTDRRGIR